MNRGGDVGCGAANGGPGSTWKQGILTNNPNHWWNRI